MYNVPLYNDELYGVQFMELQPVDAVTPTAVEGLTLYLTLVEPVTITDHVRTLITAFRLAESVIVNDWNTIDDARSNQDWTPEH